jgi:hypothetical protein
MRPTALPTAMSAIAVVLSPPLEAGAGVDEDEASRLLGAGPAVEVTETSTTLGVLLGARTDEEGGAALETGALETGVVLAGATAAEVETALVAAADWEPPLVMPFTTEETSMAGAGLGEAAGAAEARALAVWEAPLLLADVAAELSSIPMIESSCRGLWTARLRTIRWGLWIATASLEPTTRRSRQGNRTDMFCRMVVLAGNKEEGGWDYAERSTLLRASGSRRPASGSEWGE